MNIGKYKLDGGGSCPEQYDVYVEGNPDRVAYLRLRHGHFRAELTNPTKIVYSAEPRGDGAFECEERDHYLTEAIQAINKALNPSKEFMVACPDCGAELDISIDVVDGSYTLKFLRHRT